MSDEKKFINAEGDLTIENGQILLDLGRAFRRISFTPEEAEFFGNCMLALAKQARKERLNG